MDLEGENSGSYLSAFILLSLKHEKYVGEQRTSVKWLTQIVGRQISLVSVLGLLVNTEGSFESCGHIFKERRHG